MRHITVNQQRVLDRIYTYAVETGDWPGAQALRLELYRAYKLKLEDIGREIDDLVVCNDVSVEMTTCLIRLPALEYIDGAKQDRRLIGKLVAWLVQCYLNGKSKGLTRELAAEALEADQKTTDRVIGFVYHTSGLLNAESKIGNNTLGCMSFGVDERIVDFDGVHTYEGLLAALERRAVALREHSEQLGMTLRAQTKRQRSKRKVSTPTEWGGRWIAFENQRPVIRGQGEVWRVWDKNDTRIEPWKRPIYALKRLRYDAGPNSAKYRRFVREIEQTKALSVINPNIVLVVDHGIPKGRDESELFYVMPFASGALDRAKDLAGRLEPVLEIGVVIANALIVAHDAGIVHRDVKPGNILLFDEERRPVLADFGICYLTDAERLTNEEAPTVGSKDFVAPELLGGGTVEGVDGRADIYSLGKTLYAVLAGGDVFPREAHRTPTWNLVARRGDSRLAHLHGLLDNMVTESPDDRYASMRKAHAQLARALDNVRSGIPFTPGMYGGGDTAVERATRFQTALESVTGTKLRDQTQAMLDQAIAADAAASGTRAQRASDYDVDPAVRFNIRNAANDLLSAGLPLITGANEEFFGEWLSVVAEPIDRKGPEHHCSHSRSVLRAAACLSIYCAIGHAWNLRRWNHLKPLLSELARDPAGYLHLDHLRDSRAALYPWLVSEANELSVIQRLGAFDADRMAIASGLAALYGMRVQTDNEKPEPFPGFAPEAASRWVPSLARTFLTRRPVEAAIGGHVFGFTNWTELRPWALSIRPRLASMIAKSASNSQVVNWHFNVDPTKEWDRWTSTAP